MNKTISKFSRDPKVRYLVALNTIEVIVVFIYYRFFEGCIEFNTIRYSVLLGITCGTVHFISYKEKNRNFTILVCSSVLPIMLNEMLESSKYFINVKFALTVLGGIVIYMLLTSTKPRALKIISVFSCIVLMGLCIYTRVLIKTHKIVEFFESNFSDFSDLTNEITKDDENSLANNIEICSKIDGRGGWEKLSLNEKAEVLQAFMKVECNYLGMLDSMPKIEISYMENNLLGQYNKETDTISLSYNEFIDYPEDGYTVLSTLCHELRHRYQRYQIEAVQALKGSKYEELLMFWDASVYEQEFTHYLNGFNDNYDLYRQQSIEKDARLYAEISVDEYKLRIDTYFEEVIIDD